MIQKIYLTDSFSCEIQINISVHGTAIFLSFYRGSGRLLPSGWSVSHSADTDLILIFPKLAFFQKHNLRGRKRAQHAGIHPSTWMFKNSVFEHKLIRLHSTDTHLIVQSSTSPMIFYRAHPGAPVCWLTEVGCKTASQKLLCKKKKKVFLLFRAHFYNLLANTWLEIAGFDPLSKHRLDLGPFLVLIVCLYKPCCLQCIRYKFPVFDRAF